MNDNPNQYKHYFKLTDIFPVYGPGIVTAMDGLAIQQTKEDMLRIVTDLAKMSEDEVRRAYNLKEDAPDWKLLKAQADIREYWPSKQNLVQILYRPFDVRYTYYTGKSRGFISLPSREVMRQMLLDNIGLVVSRQEDEKEFNNCLVTDTIIENKLMSGGKGTCHLFPFYLYRETGYRYANIKNSFLNRLKSWMNVQLVIEAEKVFYYVYAVLFSPAYRKRYAQYLKSDFPRIPFPYRNDLFYHMAGLGELLARAHLLTSPELKDFSVNFKAVGGQAVKLVKFSPESSDSGKLYVNDSDYFLEIPSSVWEYRLGGNKVLFQLLSGYIGRVLCAADVEHISKVISSLQLSMRYQERIDELFLMIEKSKMIPPQVKIDSGAGDELKKGRTTFSDKVLEFLFELSPLDASNMNAKDLAGHLGVRPNYLVKHFESGTGQTISKYLLSHRLITSAVYMVQYPETLMWKVAEKFGFSSPDSYMIQFKKMFGVAPEKFRERWYHHMGKAD